MIATDLDALICDLAETYNIYNMWSLSPSVIATFSIGLRDDSRIKLKMSGQIVPLNTLLLASAVDRLSLLLWSKSKDAEYGRNKPKMITEQFINSSKTEKDFIVFDSPEAFEQAMAEINNN